MTTNGTKTEKMTEKEKAEIALTKNPLVNAVMDRIAELSNSGRLAFPQHYAPQNALMSAYLILQQTTNRERKPILQVCTKESIANALLDTVVQGLSPAKRQVYFIAYGDKLIAMRSYFGTIALTKRLLRTDYIVAEVVYADDEFEFTIEHGNTVITRHDRTLAAIDRSKIVAAYCVVKLPDGEFYAQVMTIGQIYESWKKSQNNPFDDKGVLKSSSVHGQFPEEMAKRTVVQRTCKMLINATDDSTLDLVIHHMHRSDEVADEVAFGSELDESANQEYIDVEVAEVDQTATTTDAKSEPKTATQLRQPF